MDAIELANLMQPVRKAIVFFEAVLPCECEREGRDTTWECPTCKNLAKAYAVLDKIQDDAVAAVRKQRT